MNLRDVWNAQAEAWTRFARDARGDRTNLEFNIPRFLEIVPGPGRRTLDLGCGEGRVAAVLGRGGHDVVGIDSSVGMAAAASELVETVVANAVDLPFAAASFDLVVAFMSLMDMDDMPAAVCEAARVLQPGGRLCIAVVHPINSAGTFETGAFVVRGSYFEPRRIDAVFERGPFRIVFAAEHHPLEAYSRALERAGLSIEAVREPQHPDPNDDWSRVPLFLHVRAVKR